jgi:hypothetical protein
MRVALFIMLVVSLPLPLFASLEESFNPEGGGSSAFLEYARAIREKARPSLSDDIIVSGLAPLQNNIGVIPGPPSLSYLKKNMHDDRTVVALLAPKDPPAVAFLGSVGAVRGRPVFLTGRVVPTERSYAEGLIIEKVTQLPVIIPSETGERLMGACDDEEVVIALYKKVEEYTADPNATITTRVRLCVNGSYSYALRDLPASLPDGKYYLLVSQRFGSGFPQTPLSALAEVVLERKLY